MVIDVRSGPDIGVASLDLDVAAAKARVRRRSRPAAGPRRRSRDAGPTRAPPRPAPPGAPAAGSSALLVGHGDPDREAIGNAHGAAAEDRPSSIARSIRRCNWTGWTRVPKSRALGRSTRRSKKRSTADIGRFGRIGRSLPEPGASAMARDGYRWLDQTGTSCRSEAGESWSILRNPRADRAIEDGSNPGPMTEILTESFCERCGTRYTFESAAPRQRRMGGLKVLGRGLKNFVMSDDSSLDEAFAAARSDVERDATSQQLDAFHRTFNFCMSCRQYTCANCWNEVEARCLSCAPLAIAETAPALDDVGSGSTPSIDRPGGRRAPRTDRRAYGRARACAGDGRRRRSAQPREAIGAAQPVAEPVLIEALPSCRRSRPSTPAPAEPAVAEPAETPPATIGGLAAGQTIDDAVAAYEASQAADATRRGRGGRRAWLSTVEERDRRRSRDRRRQRSRPRPTGGACLDARGRGRDAAAAEAELPAPLRSPTPTAPRRRSGPAAESQCRSRPRATRWPEAGSPGVDVIAQPVWPTAPPGIAATPAGDGSGEHAGPRLADWPALAHGHPGKRRDPAVAGRGRRPIRWPPSSPGTRPMRCGPHRAATSSSRSRPRRRRRPSSRA